MPIPFYPTGTEVFDFGDCPGLPAGRVVHLFGDENTGKTTLALLAAAEVARGGWQVAYIDWTNGIVPDFAAHLGAGLREFLASFALFQPSTQLEGAQIAAECIKGGINLLVLDGFCGDVNQFTTMADRIETIRMWTQHFPALKEAARKADVAILVMSRGNRQGTQCGKTLKFYADRRIFIQRRAFFPEIDFAYLKDKLGSGGDGVYSLPIPLPAMASP